MGIDCYWFTSREWILNRNPHIQLEEVNGLKQIFFLIESYYCSRETNYCSKESYPHYSLPYSLICSSLLLIAITRLFSLAHNPITSHDSRLYSDFHVICCFHFLIEHKKTIDILYLFRPMI